VGVKSLGIPLEYPANDNDPCHAWPLVVIDIWRKEELAEIIMWCDANLKSASWQSWQQGQSSCWMFRNVDDMVLFQMTWG